MAVVSITRLAVTSPSSGLAMLLAVMVSAVLVQYAVLVRLFGYVSRLPTNRASPRGQVSNHWVASQMSRMALLNIRFNDSANSVDRRDVGTPISAHTLDRKSE